MIFVLVIRVQVMKKYLIVKIKIGVNEYSTFRPVLQSCKQQFQLNSLN